MDEDRGNELASGPVELLHKFFFVSMYQIESVDAGWGVGAGTATTLS